MATSSTRFEVDNLQTDLVEFEEYIDSVDMEKVFRTTIKEAATTLAEMVRQAVVAEEDIRSPARLNSPFENGPGPSMARRRAWKVKKKGDRYIVKPHPEVEQRATVLNSGWGTITPNSADKLAFTVSGIPSSSEGTTETRSLIQKDSVDGPDETAYWQAALRRFEESDELERIGVRELREEALR